MGEEDRIGGPMPAGACDCHTHVFGPPDRYPFDPGRSYTPGQASVEDLLAHQARLGLERVVIVQPSPYGMDNTPTLDAVRQIGALGQVEARAVAVIDPSLPLSELRLLHGAGVRGIRLNLETAGQSDPTAAATMLAHAARQVEPLGWHVQMYTNLGVIAALHDQIGALPVPCVIDHFGRAMAGVGPGAGVGQPGFAALLDLVERGSAYVKLSAAHRIATPAEAAGPIAEALIAANPARMVWGSDWPHPGGRPGGTRDPSRIEAFDIIDDAAALRNLRRWAGSEAVFRTILADNPARLYGFGS